MLEENIKIEKNWLKIISDHKGIKAICFLIWFAILIIAITVIILILSDKINTDDIDIKSRIMRWCLPIWYAVLFALSTALVRLSDK